MFSELISQSLNFLAGVLISGVPATCVSKGTLTVLTVASAFATRAAIHRSLWALRARNRKKDPKKGLFRGLQKKSLKTPENSEKVFVSQERVSGFPEKEADLRGSLGNFRGSLGNFRGTSGLLFSSTVRELPGSRRKTSGEVRGTSGEVRGLPRSSGEPDSLPATRQSCLQKCSEIHRKLVLLDFFGDFEGLFCRPPKRPFLRPFCAISGPETPQQIKDHPHPQ